MPAKRNAEASTATGMCRTTLRVVGRQSQVGEQQPYFAKRTWVLPSSISMALGSCSTLYCPFGAFCHTFMMAARGGSCYSIGCATLKSMRLGAGGSWSSAAERDKQHYA